LRYSLIRRSANKNILPDKNGQAKALTQGNKPDMSSNYNADAIEVLTGLDPVRKRPGMYTDTSRPNHLVQEVLDNSVDEALAGHATTITLTMHKDGAIEVEDDGRGMPVDIHKEEKVSGIELIMTRLHAGGKFSDKNYNFSGGLHGVGVSVVNALSHYVEVTVRRDGLVHQMRFENGYKATDLKQIGTVAKRQSGTILRFVPDEKYFDSAKVSITRLKHVLRAKAVLCSGLRVVFIDNTVDEDKAQSEEWLYQDGLIDYLLQGTGDSITVPVEPFAGDMKGNDEAVEWAVLWLPDGGELLQESYVNLIPTAQGGTHVNGLRTGLLDAMREFCEFRNLMPRGVKLTPEDIWDRCSYVVSTKMKDPQFSGQTKERLSSRQSAAFVSGIVKDAFSLWLNQHTADAELLADMCITNAQGRMRASKKVERKRVTSGPALPGKLADCSTQDVMAGELFLVEGDSAGGSAKQARDRETQAIMPLRGKILNTWEVDSNEILGSQEVHDISVALGVDPGSNDIAGLRYGKICILADADSDGLHIATLLCALFVKHFKPLVAAGRIYVAMPPLYRIDAGKEVYYALDEDERVGILDRLAAEKKNVKVNVQRFKGLGEMNPLQLRETTMSRDTRRLVQLTLPADDMVAGRSETDEALDMLLAKKRAPDRKSWLEEYGNLADIAD